MLRDRVVCGINEATIQCRLLVEAHLTFQKAIKLAKEWRQQHRTRGSCNREGPVVTSEVNQVATKDKKQSCLRCGKPGHQAAKCKFKGAKCHHCGKTGHLQAVCRSKQKGYQGKTDRQDKFVWSKRKKTVLPCLSCMLMGVCTHQGIIGSRWLSP